MTARCYYCRSRIEVASESELSDAGWVDIEPDWRAPDLDRLGVCPMPLCQAWLSECLHGASHG